jgi:uncharacterized protein (TIGR03435 family)
VATRCELPARIGVLALAVLSPLSTITLAQTSAAAAPVRFEAVSIKPNTGSLSSDSGAAAVGPQAGGRFVMRDGATIVLIRSAYTDAVDVLGLPEWAVSKGRYDVEAKAAFRSAPPQMEQMLRTMLADRFKLQAHYEQRGQQVYALRVARGDGRLGPGIRPYGGDCAADAEAARTGKEKPTLPEPANGAPACGYMNSGRLMLAGGIPLEALAGALRGLAGRIVVDRTGLFGNYEFRLETDNEVTVFTALREQLGLKLDPEVVPLPVLVVDRIEPPTEN